MVRLILLQCQFSVVKDVSAALFTPESVILAWGALQLLAIKLVDDGLYLRIGFVSKFILRAVVLVDDGDSEVFGLLFGQEEL